MKQISTKEKQICDKNQRKNNFSKQKNSLWALYAAKVAKKVQKKRKSCREEKSVDIIGIQIRL